MQHLDLLPQEVDLQTRVWRPHLSGIIREAVMALSKDIDGIDVRILQRARKCRTIEVGADIPTIRGCVKIKMDLSVTKRKSIHRNPGKWR